MLVPDNGQQQLPIVVGNSADVFVRTTVTNNGPHTPIDAALSSRTITPPQGSDGAGVIVIPAVGTTPNENGVTTTTIVTSLNDRQQQDETYTIECWEPGLYNIIFESEVVSLSGAVADANELNNNGQMNLEVDCIEIGPPIQPSEPLGVSLNANVTEDGLPPTTIEFRAITQGGTQPHKFRWNFDDGSNNNNDVKGGQLMTHQFTRLGQYDVTVTATDSADGIRGQSASDNIIVTISDKEAPRVIVPSHITVEATGPDGANVTFTVSATDIVDGSVPVSCQVQSGDTFQLGTTTVNCQATDSSNNTGYGSFPVTVQDTRPPTLELPNLPPVEATGPDGAVVNFTVSATDIVDGTATLEEDGTTITQDQVGHDITIRCDPRSGSTYRIETTIVDCEAIDSSGNSENGNFTVTVQDTTPPLLTGPPPITVEATGPDGANVTFFIEATDIVDGTATLGNNGILIQDQVGHDITISAIDDLVVHSD